MKTQMTLSEMLKNGNQPIFFKKGKSRRAINDNQVDVWMPFEYSHKFWRTMSEKYVRRICRKNGIDYNKKVAEYSEC